MPQTDSLIQRTIRRVFAERATLTIAHRLDTIIFSDKILAMAQGQVGGRCCGQQEKASWCHASFAAHFKNSCVLLAGRVQNPDAPHALWWQVKEFDKPSTLLDDPHSMFNRLVEDTGAVASTMLRQMAAAGPQDDTHSQPGSRKVSEADASSSAASSRPASDGH